MCLRLPLPQTSNIPRRNLSVAILHAHVHLFIGIHMGWVEQCSLSVLVMQVITATLANAIIKLGFWQLMCISGQMPGHYCLRQTHTMEK